MDLIENFLQNIIRVGFVSRTTSDEPLQVRL
jgi:hypothetical protein